MSTQLRLPLVRPALEDLFDEWLVSKDGQVVYVEVVRRALRLREQGIKRYGIAALFEAIRYDRAVELGKDAAGFRLNHNHRSRLARLVMAKTPVLAGFFEVRRMEGEE
jgi:hypothetical protein